MHNFLKTVKTEITGDISIKILDRNQKNAII